MSDEAAGPDGGAQGGDEALSRNDPRLEIEAVWQRTVDWDDLDELKLVHDHLTEIQLMTLHRMYLLARGEASLRNKKKNKANHVNRTASS